MTSKTNLPSPFRMAKLRRQRTSVDDGSRPPCLDDMDKEGSGTKPSQRRIKFSPLSKEPYACVHERRTKSLDEPRPVLKPTAQDNPAPLTRRKTWNSGAILNSSLKPRPGILDDYKPLKEIGKGAYGTVYVVEERFSTSRKPKTFACKILDIQMNSEDTKASLKNILNEVELMMASSGHPNLQELIDFALADNHVIIISSMCYGGDLNSALDKLGTFSEQQARKAMSGIFRGLFHLHSQGIVHRDIKLDNVLIADKGGDLTSVKIIDLGFAKKLCPEVDEGMHTVCGTPLYIAPELLKQSKETGKIEDKTAYGTNIDMWACGVIMYNLLCGCPPFTAEGKTSIHEVFDDIRNGRFDFCDPIWNKTSETAKDLITKLLQVDPKKRLDAKAALRHPWLVDDDGF